MRSPFLRRSSALSTSLLCRKPGNVSSFVAPLPKAKRSHFLRHSSALRPLLLCRKPGKAPSSFSPLPYVRSSSAESQAKPLPQKQQLKRRRAAFLWQLMRYNILQLLKNLRSNSCEKDITDIDILNWANTKVKDSGRQSCMKSFKDKNLSTGIFFLELLSAVEPRVVNWSLVTKGENEDERKMNASYIISVARKLGCSIFLLPEDILEVNQKMMLTLAASIMYWHSNKPSEDKYLASNIEILSNTTVDDSASGFSR